MVMPSSISAGDLLIAFFTLDGNNAGATGWPSDWYVFPAIANAAGSITSQLAYKFASGSESNFTLSHNSEETQSRCLRITGHAGPSRPPLFRNWQGGNATGPVPVSPHEWAQSQDILSIIMLGWENTTPTPTPSGYTNDHNSHTGGAGGIGLRQESQAISGFSGTEDPANYTTGSGNRVGWTILVPSDADAPDLTYPIVRNWFPRATGSGTSVSVPLSPQRQVGDILMVAIGLITNVTISSGIPDGWTTEVSVQGGGSGGERMYVLWKRADGTETDFTLTLSATSAWAVQTLCIFNANENTDIISGTATGGSNNAADAPNLSATGYLWLAIAQHETSSVTAFPTNYTHRQEALSSGASIAIAARQLIASSENPGAYTQSGSSFWTAATIAVAAPFQTTLAEDISDTDTTFDLTGVDGIPDTLPFDAAIPDPFEIVRVTSRSGNTVTATRGVAGTPGAAHANGKAFREVVYEELEATSAGSGAGSTQAWAAPFTGVPLWGSTSARARATGEADLEISLDGRTVGVGSASAALDVSTPGQVPLTGASTGHGGANATLSVAIALGGTTAGSGSGYGLLGEEVVTPPTFSVGGGGGGGPAQRRGRFWEIGGAAYGSAQAWGALRIAVGLAGRVVGESTTRSSDMWIGYTRREPVAVAGEWQAMASSTRHAAEATGDLSVQPGRPIWQLEEIDPDLAELQLLDRRER